MGREGGEAGYPIADELNNSEQYFQNGEIVIDRWGTASFKHNR